MEKEKNKKEENTSEVVEQQSQTTKQPSTLSKIAYYGFWGTCYTAYYAVRFTAKALYWTGYGLYKACEFGYNCYQNATNPSQEETDTSKQPISSAAEIATEELTNKSNFQRQIDDAISKLKPVKKQEKNNQETNLAESLRKRVPMLENHNDDSGIPEEWDEEESDRAQGQSSNGVSR